MKCYKTIYLLVSVFFWCSCIAQTSNEMLPINLLNRWNRLKDGNTTVISKETAYDLTQYLPTGYSKAGDKDYTTFIQNGLNERRVVLMPDFPVLINDSGLKLKSNTTIYFQKNSRLLLKPSSKSRYYIIDISSVHDINIINPYIIGDRFSHLNTVGQWGYGIFICSSQNIKIFNANISNCWGDGICIGGVNGISPSGILIDNALLNNNRRNALTISSGDDLIIKNSIFANSNGHMPMSGIDIEPDNNYYELKDINILSPYSYNNYMHGIVISPGNLKGKNRRNVSILIDSPVDSASRIGLGVSLERLGASKVAGLPLEGLIKIKNPIWKNNKGNGFKDYGNRDNLLILDISNIKIFNKINGKEVLDSKNLLDLKKRASINRSIQIR